VPPRTRLAVLLGVLTLGLSITGVARAQGTDHERRALARSLFEEGLRFGQAEQWDQAADRFERAYELAPSAAIATNLASALIPLGQLVRASELLRESLESPSASAPVLRLAQSLLETEVEPRLGYLTIHVAGPMEGVTVRRNDVEVPRAALGVSMPVDPGIQGIEAVRSGRPVAVEQVDVPEGQRVEVTLQVPARVPSPESVGTGAFADEPSLLDPQADDVGDGGIATRWWFWTAIGVVVAAAGVTVALLLTSGGAAEPIGGNSDPPWLEGSVP